MTPDPNPADEVQITKEGTVSDIPKIAEEIVNRCDGIVTMDSDQRRGCKAWIEECVGIALTKQAGEIARLEKALADVKAELAIARHELTLNAAVFRNDACHTGKTDDEIAVRIKWAEETEAVINGTSINERWKKMEEAEDASHSRACDAETRAESAERERAAMRERLAAVEVELKEHKEARLDSLRYM